MINVFGKNHEEIGSLDKNLVLQTKGKVKIRYGRKYIDLLDNNGNINVKIPKILKKVNSKDEIVPDGIYLYDGDLYANIGEEIIQFTGSVEGDYLIYSSDQELTQEQIEQVWKNLQLNKLEELTLNEPLSSINNSGLNYPSDNVMLVFKNGNWQYVTYNSGNTNNQESSSSSGGGISSGQFSPETLKDLESETPFITNPQNWKTKDNKKLLDPNKINPNNNGIKIGAISTDHLISYGTEFKETTKTVNDQEVVQDYSYPRYSDILNTDLVNNHSSGEGYDNVVPTIGWVKNLIDSEETLGQLLTALNNWDTLIESSNTGGVLLHTHLNGRNYFSWKNSLDTILSWMTDVSSSGDIGKYLYCESYNNGYQYTWKEIPAPSGGDTLNEPLSGINNANLGTPTSEGLTLVSQNINGDLSWTYANMPGSTFSVRDQAENRKQLLDQACPIGSLIMTPGNQWTAPFGYIPYTDMDGKVPISNVNINPLLSTGGSVPTFNVHFWQRVGEPYFQIKYQGSKILSNRAAVFDTFEQKVFAQTDYYSVNVENTSVDDSFISTKFSGSSNPLILYPRNYGLTLFNETDIYSIRINNIYELKGEWDLYKIGNNYTGWAEVVLGEHIKIIYDINFGRRDSNSNKLTINIERSDSVLTVNNASSSESIQYFLGPADNSKLSISISSAIINSYQNDSRWGIYSSCFITH